MFTNLPRCSQSMNSLTYVQTPSCFLYVLELSRDHTSLYYRRLKKVLYYPCGSITFTLAGLNIENLYKRMGTWAFLEFNAYSIFYFAQWTTNYDLFEKYFNSILKMPSYKYWFIMQQITPFLIT